MQVCKFVSKALCKAPYLQMCIYKLDIYGYLAVYALILFSYVDGRWSVMTQWHNCTTVQEHTDVYYSCSVIFHCMLRIARYCQVWCCIVSSWHQCSRHCLPLTSSFYPQLYTEGVLLGKEGAGDPASPLRNRLLLCVSRLLLTRTEQSTFSHTHISLQQVQARAGHRPSAFQRGEAREGR